MTRQDYVLIAQALRDALNATTDEKVREGVMLAGFKLADALASENPRFDRGRFAVAVSAGQWEYRRDA